MTGEEYDADFVARTEMHEIQLDIHVLSGVKVTLDTLCEHAEHDKECTQDTRSFLRGLYEDVVDRLTSAEVMAGIMPGETRTDTATNAYVRIMECERILTFTMNYHLWNTREATRRRIALYAKRTRQNPASSRRNRV